MVATPTLLLPIVIFSALIITVVIIVSSRKLKTKQMELKTAAENIADIKKRMVSLRDDLKDEKRSIERSARSRVRRLDLSSKALVYNHLLDHLERWKKGDEDLSVTGRFVRESSDKLSRKVRDYWEKVEGDTPENARGLIPSLEEHLRRRVIVFTKELEGPANDSIEGSLDSVKED